MYTDTKESPFNLVSGSNGLTVVRKKIRPSTVTGLKRLWVALRVRLTILRIAWNCYGSLVKSIRLARKLTAFKKAINGKEGVRRCIKHEGKYYFGLYIPGFPSKTFNRYVQTELNQILPHNKAVNHLQVLQLAITNRCPLKCEHCFEWQNLNKPEPFTTGELTTLVNKFQKSGCALFHLTGGEPMARMDRLKTVVATATGDSDFYVLTSGLNLTRENAKLLREAGFMGVIISLDHFDPAMHNIFRGSTDAFNNAVNGAYYARQAGLLTAFSLCVTRSFVTEANLFKYVQLARNCGVAFVQILEPKPAGHWEGKDVMLGREQTRILEKFYLQVNYGKAYKDYPVVLYHGLHQRTLGCLSINQRIVYIDSAGFVDACPFCQTKTFRASSILSGELSVDDIKINTCPIDKPTANPRPHI